MGTFRWLNPLHSSQKIIEIDNRFYFSIIISLWCVSRKSRIHRHLGLSILFASLIIMTILMNKKKVKRILFIREQCGVIINGTRFDFVECLWIKSDESLFFLCFPLKSRIIKDVDENYLGSDFNIKSVFMSVALVHPCQVMGIDDEEAKTALMWHFKMCNRSPCNWIIYA